MRYRLDICYDGAGFSGWATQPGLRTVQGELETWLQRILRTDFPVNLTCAGRTDAGVHALGQVCHLDLPDDFIFPVRHGALSVEVGLQQRLARALPNDLAVTKVSLVPQDFDARFSALWRRYRYRIADTNTPINPLHRHTVVTVSDNLQLSAMNDAANHLLGLRDFAAFCKKRDGATTIRELQTLYSERNDAGVIETVVQADAFCHSMVRSLMGALVAVGSGRRTLEWLDNTLAAHIRSNDTRVMPAQGLVLEAVGYPANNQLAARAQTARATRCLEQEC